MRASVKKAVFLDRDGVLNRNVYYEDLGEWESPRAPEDLVLFDSTVPALRQLQVAGFMLFVVSNQPSYAKGKTSLENLKRVHDKLSMQLEDQAITIEAYYYCYHHPKGIIPEYTMQCECRKPSPFFLRKAIEQYDLDVSECWMVGDRDSDLACAEAAGCRAIAILPDHINAVNSSKTQKSKHMNLLSCVTQIIGVSDVKSAN